MPVSEDQRALLRLLLDGSDYTQISELLGVDESEVRARAATAVRDLEQEGGDAELAEAAKRRMGYLEGTEPAPPPAAPPAQGGPRSWGPATWILIGGALVAIVVVLIVIAGGGGSDGTTTSPNSSSQEDVVRIQLEPVGGGSAHGTVSIVRVADRPAVDLDVAGLQPTAQGETYVLYLLDSTSGKTLPVAFRDVGPDGRFSGRTEIADAATSLLPNFNLVEISIARDQEAAASVQAAARNATLPTQIGTPVLRGNLRGSSAP